MRFKMPPLPTPENKISWNGVVAIVAAFVSAGIAYGAMRSELAQLRSASVPVAQFVALEAELRSVVAQQAADTARVQALQGEVNRNNITTARMQEQLAAVLAVTSRIERSVDRLVETARVTQ